MNKKRGRKPLGKTDLHARVLPQTPLTLREKAKTLGFIYDNSGATGEMLDAIAKGQLAIIPQEDLDKINILVGSFKEIMVK